MPPPSGLKKLVLRIRAAAYEASELTTISFSFRPIDSIRALKTHRWQRRDLQYVLLGGLLAFVFIIAEAPVLFKFAAACLLSALLLVPITSQFFLPFLPCATWLLFFFSCRFIPASYRPPISVRVLPALENILFGANISNILAKHTNPVLDVLGWLPYGVIHFGAPFVCSAFIFIFGPPETVPIFAASFGYMNIIGVMIQILFPCSPPWYENLYGLAPANYGMPGSPGGLARIDQLFGGNGYTSTFTASPMVFGAFPSLHSGSATIEAMFLAHCFPKIKPFVYGYVLWIWWATMYLTHHYFVDLIGGSILAAAVFYYAERNHLPQIQPGKYLRWDYEYIVRGHTDAVIGSKGEFSRLPALDTDLELGDDTDWAIGSGSSTSSGLNTPVTETSSIGWQSDGSRAHDEDIEEVVRQIVPARPHTPKSPTKFGPITGTMKAKKQALA